MKREDEYLAEIVAYKRAIRVGEARHDPAEAEALMRAKRKLAGLAAKLERLRDRYAKAIRT